MSGEQEVNEQELFDNVTTQEAESEQPEAEQVETQPRDEAGRFAKPEAEQPEAEAAEPERQDHRIPLAEHLSTRERAQKAEQERDTYRQQLESLQRQPAQRPQPQQTENEPDPLLDPKGFRDHITQQVQQNLLSERREMSLQMASVLHRDEFPEAYKAAQAAMASGDANLQARMQSSRDPGTTLIEWHREQKTVREVNGDLNGWFEKQLAERLKDPAFMTKLAEAQRPADNSQRPNVQLPPSLGRVASAQSRRPAGNGFDASDGAALFDEITTR